MIALSLALVVVAAVLLILGVAQDGLALVYVSIATCVAGMVVLGLGVLLHRRRESAAGPAGYADALPTDGSTGAATVARTPADETTSGDQQDPSEGRDTER